MKRTTIFKKNNILCLTLLLTLSELTIAQSNFSAIGSENSGGAGYKLITLSTDGGVPIMIASNNLLPDGTTIYPTGNVDPLIFSLKADGTNAGSWDVSGMTISSPIQDYNFSSSTITFKDADGNTVATMSTGNGNLTDVVVSADAYFSGDNFPINDVAEIIFNMPGGDADDNFTINTITLEDVKAPITDNTAPNITSANMLDENGAVATEDQIYRNGDTVFVGITYDEEITYTGSPYITISSLSQNASLLRLSADNMTAIFGHKVDGEDDEIVLTIADAITLNGGTITDIAGNAADLTFSLTVPSGSITNSFDHINTSDIISTCYPNPTTTGLLTIDLKSPYQQLSVNIKDTQGQLLDTFSFGDNEEIKLSLPETKGLYFVELLTEKGKVTIKALRQ